MNRRVVIVSYVIVLASAIYLLVPRAFYPYDYYAALFEGGYVLNTIAVAGLVLGPYFALAGFVVKDKSVWAEVNRMIHAHISFPLIAGLALFYTSAIPGIGGFFIIPAYAVFVFLATLITVMASRTNEPMSPPPSAGTNSSQHPTPS